MMAAATRRRLEETHLKLLRDMTSLPANRRCFDCDQRGPTYVNMTVGSFVCTTCSGILRGLNPPHRVKSISMTTFTQQEIEFLQKHSNEVCKHIWLGLYDDRTSVVPDFREPQKVKEFLQEKYEKKRWFVPPDQARAIASVQVSVPGSSASSSGSMPEVQPIKSLHLNKTLQQQSPGPSRSSHPATQEKKFDLLSDLGADIFAALPQAADINFANFAHFNQSGGGVPIPSVSGATAHSHSGSHSEDRYAALAELDNKLSSSTSSTSSLPANIFGPVLGSSPGQNPPLLPSMQSGFGAVPSTNPFVSTAVATDMATNPFQTNGRAPPAASFTTASLSMPAGFGNSSSFCLPTSFSGSFQRQSPVPNAPPTTFHPQANGPPFQVYTSTKPSATPFTQPVVLPNMSSNPFMAGATGGSFSSASSATNPFL